MRGDVDGYTSEFNPANAIYKVWYPEYKNVKMWRLVGNGFITLDDKKRLAMYKELEKILLDGAAAGRRSSRSRSSRSCASASRTCTSRSATSTPA